MVLSLTAIRDECTSRMNLCARASHTRALRRSVFRAHFNTYSLLRFWTVPHLYGFVVQAIAAIDAAKQVSFYGARPRTGANGHPFL
jgi:hypothetical protein